MKKERIAGFVSAWKISCAALSLTMLLGMASCGSKKTEITVNPMTSSILGPAGDVFEVVDKPRTLTVSDNYSFDLSVSLKRTAEGSVKDIDWGLELLDENDEVIVSDEDIWFADGKDTLEGVKVGETGSLKLPIHYNVDGSRVKKISKYRVTSKAKKDWGSVDEEVVVEETSPEEVATESVKSSSSNENWDKILDEYETVCDKAVKLAKKAQAGDISAVTEYAELAEKATSLQNKLQNAEAELTPAQVARLSKIAAKLASSMM